MEYQKVNGRKKSCVNLKATFAWNETVKIAEQYNCIGKQKGFNLERTFQSYAEGKQLDHVFIKRRHFSWARFHENVAWCSFLLQWRSESTDLEVLVPFPYLQCKGIFFNVLVDYTIECGILSESFLLFFLWEFKRVVDTFSHARKKEKSEVSWGFFCLFFFFYAMYVIELVRI